MRNISIIDGVGLLVAAACAIGLVVFIDRNNGCYFFTRMPEASRRLVGERRPFEISQLGFYVQGLTEEFSLGATVPTAAIFLVRLRKPRPPLRRLFLELGMSALSAVLAVQCLFFAPRWVHWFYRAGESHGDACLSYLVQDFPAATMASGMGVAIVWFNMRVSGRWRPEASWRGRAGIAVGVYWICAAAIIGWQRYGFGLYS